MTHDAFHGGFGVVSLILVSYFLHVPHTELIYCSTSALFYYGAQFPEFKVLI